MARKALGSGTSGTSGSSDAAVPVSRRRKKTLTASGKRKRKNSKKVGPRKEPDIFADDGSESTEGKPRSWAEWEDMTPCESFKMDGQVFRKNDSAAVNSSSGNENLWLVHIRQIRVKSETAWVLVHWYYSAADLAAEYEPESPLYLNDQELSANERVCSDRKDILSCHMFERVVKVVEWNEGAVPCPPIAPGDYFCRTRFSWTKSEWEIAPGAHTCIGCCNRTYDPFLSPEIYNASHVALSYYYRGIAKDDGSVRSPSGMLLDADYMHFCSRPSCRRWYHRACLLHKDRYLEEAGIFLPGTREIRRLALDPWVEAQDVDSRLQRYTFPQIASGKMSSETYTALDIQGLLERDFTVAVGAGGRLPESVVRVAVRPIVRRADGCGGRSTAGYVEEIVLAQNLVHQQLELSLEEFERQMDEVDRVYGSGWVDIPRVWKYVEEMMKRSRLLASPLPRYWESLDDEMEAVYGEEVFPPLLCANCSGAI